VTTRFISRNTITRPRHVEIQTRGSHGTVFSLVSANACSGATRKLIEEAPSVAVNPS
jgi:acetyl/propionyl-CoA carboxylase alpha subunit